ncbi:chromosome segregation SMC family protein [Pseudoalteromonas aurantia]|uniref:Chromosome partition protein Smc n=1 Tax=Pseudoalteromonas aurantia TaxID=43654 RepID=A0A5S3V8J7_9GAMM|nr:AAA family ATPase [Pseudoalteromonas aurantia]TMO61329.1 chromosome segregation protein SMC [Pseudoalteromonas aurantia]TMO68146.1 chromosome segregation protein SMC [Pseudoalteromonas aurantia]TMO72280.1 chromosome segregation protein SMC [Pseudoalteromonas aurantia]
MRLSSIKLAGFKSFVEPTKIPFLDEMTCVVGPNGCGKSNVIDAVRWVLGESSAKNLRGDAMTDVIFNGSTHRKPISQASVELMFDNAQGRLPGTLADRNTVSIKRLVTRDGQSLYFLNGSKCRKRDITDIFLGTGLGPRSYAIIEQGMISRLIESKPQELRVFLEEAAGVSKYKERRRETQTRIKNTRENLERLLDVRKELQLQLDRLAIQAKDAQYYRALKQQERTYKGQLAVLKWQSFHQKQQQRLQHITKVQSEITFLNTAHSGHHDVLAALEGQVTHLNDGIAEQQLSIHQIHTNLTKAEQQKIHLVDKHSELQKQAIIYKADTADAQVQLTALKVEATESHEQLQESIESQLITQLQLDEYQHIHDELLSKNQADEIKLQTSIGLLEQYQAEYTKKEQHYLQAQQSHKHNQEKQQELTDQVNALVADDPREKSKQDQQALVDKTQKVAQLHAVGHVLTSQINTLTQQHNGAQQALKEQQQVHTHLIANIDALATVLAVTNTDEHRNLLSTLRVTAGFEMLVERALLGLSTLNVTDSPADNAVWPFAQQAKVGSVAQFIESDIYPSLLNRVQLIESNGSFNTHEQWIFGIDLSGGLHGDNWRATIKNDEQDSILSQHARLRTLEERLPNVVAKLALIEQDVLTLKTQLADRQSAQADNKEQVHQLSQQVAALQSRHEILKQQSSQWRESYESLQNKLQILNGHLANDQIDLNNAEQAYTDSKTRLSQHQSQCLQLKEQFELKKSEQKQALINKELGLKKLHSATLAEQQAKSAWQLIQSKVVHSEKGYTLAFEQSQRVNEALQRLTTPMKDIDDSITQLLSSQSKQQKILDDLQQQLQHAKVQLQEKQIALKGATSEVARLRELLQKHQLDEQGLAIKAQAALEPLESLEQNVHDVLATLPENSNVNALQLQLNTALDALQALGAVNLAAISEFDEASKRKRYLDSQLDDLTSALKTLENAIRKIDKETKIRFKATFDQINDDLKELFPKVFGGGSAYLELTSDDLLESGVSIMARPPGKKNSTIHLLSGGEKALTALSLVFSIFRLNPAPFCMLDEVDAPLDDANVGRFCRLVEEMSQTVQFIYISHNKIAMEMAGKLTGVTMAEPGVSRMVAVDIEQAVQMAQA